MIGINGYEFIILIVLALVLLGPERLPEYAQTLGRWVRQARGMAEDAKVRFREETGTDFDEIDWQKYDPRQYDPRRIIREALSEEYEETRQAVTSVRKAAELEPGESARGSGRRPTSRSSAARSRRRLSASRGGSGTGSSRPRPSRAGTAGAAKRADDGADPRAIFSSAETAPAGGALAAGMAGAAAAGRTVASPEEAEQEQPRPAPFDDDAT